MRAPHPFFVTSRCANHRILVYNLHVRISIPLTLTMFSRGGSMKRIVVTGFLILVVSVAFSQFSLGVMVGQPTGLSARLEMGGNLSLDLGAAYSFFWISGVHIHADVVYVDRSLLRISDNSIPIYFGAGVRYIGAYWFGLSYSTISARVPIGVLYPFHVSSDVNLEVFAEVVPTIKVYPDFNFDVSFALGVRYRF